jgi:hypothetical protein
MKDLPGIAGDELRANAFVGESGGYPGQRMTLVEAERIVRPQHDLGFAEQPGEIAQRRLVIDQGIIE